MSAQTQKARRDWGEGTTLLVVLLLLVAVPNRYTFGGPIVSFVLAVVYAATCISAFVTTAIGSRKLANVVILIGASVLAVNILASAIQLLNLIGRGEVRTSTGSGFCRRLS